MNKYCPFCEDYRESVRKTRRQKYRYLKNLKKWFAVDVTADFCVECGEPIMTDEAEQAVLDQIHRKGGEDG